MAEAETKATEKEEEEAAAATAAAVATAAAAAPTAEAAAPTTEAAAPTTEAAPTPPEATTNISGEKVRVRVNLTETDKKMNVKIDKDQLINFINEIIIADNKN